MTKIAWITGSSSGIGRALAERLLRDGYRVAVSARSADALTSLATAHPGKVGVYPLDVTNADAVRQVFSTIERDMGAVDLAVFAAGSYTRDYAERLRTAAHASDVRSERAWDCGLPRNRHAGDDRPPNGHIAVVASVSGYVGLPGAATYGATKAALNVMCEALYPELERHGVKITIVNPGFVDTPLTKKNDFPMPFLVSSEEAADTIAKGLKKGKFEIIFPWKMALAIRFLHALPHALRFALTRKMLRPKGQ